jgi:peptide/nickel transport system permease protein
MIDISHKKWWQLYFHRFKNNRLARFSLYLFFLMIFIAFFADIIANERPLFISDGKSWEMPALRSQASFIGFSNKSFKTDQWDKEAFVIYSLIPYSPSNLDINNQLVSPFDKQDISSNIWRHWMGTDELGRDILSGMIHGTRYVLMIGLLSMLIALVIGLLMGCISGFYGDHSYSLSYLSIIFVLMGLFIVSFILFHSRYYNIVDSLKNDILGVLFELLYIIIVIAFLKLVYKLILRLIPKKTLLLKEKNIPLDVIVNRLIEFVVTIPVLFLILSIIAVLKPSFSLLILIIGLTYWTSIARFLRAEILKVKRLNYIESARSMGYSDIRIIARHILPNAIGPVLIIVSFGIAATILIEATLSFLGIVPGSFVTWGVLLKGAREFSSPWWVAVFPGLGIFFTVTMFNLIGEGISDANNPKIRDNV